MPIPDFQTLMRPVLELHADGQEYRRSTLVQRLGDAFQLTSEERSEVLPSGKQPRLTNRVTWATVYLVNAGLLDRPQRGVTRITDRGREALQRHPDRIDTSVLHQFEEFRQFRERTTSAESRTDSKEPDQANTPQETIELAYEQIRSSLAEELRQRLAVSTPAFFEQAVIEVLVAMGYGGSQRDAARRIGRSGDEGLDGAIYEDPLGLDIIYVQAKRWSADRPVGRPDIQGFVGALHGARASKGVFLTTSRFTDDARQYASTVTPRVVLIDGRQLAEFMIDHNVGVTPRETYILKRLDEDFFLEDSS